MSLTLLLLVGGAGTALGHAPTSIETVAEVAKCASGDFTCTMGKAMLQVSPNNISLTRSLQQCTVTYLPHDGFGNQVFGLERAAHIAYAAGCSLEVPPVLDHKDIEYHCTNLTSEVDPDLWQRARQLYEKRDLKYEHIFQLTPRLLAHGIHGGMSAPHELRSQKFLPIDRTFWKHLNQGQFERKWRELIQEHGKFGRYSIGSSFCTYTPYRRLPFSDLFVDFTPKVQAAVQLITKQLTRSHNTSQYGCIHLRQANAKGDSILKKAWRTPLAAAMKQSSRLSRPPANFHEWVTKHVSPGRSLSMPLFLMSGMPETTSHRWVGTACKDSRNGWSSCKTLSEVFPDFASLDLGIPEQAKEQYQALILELGICSGASRLFLPGIDTFIVDGRNHYTEKSGLKHSTLSRFLKVLNNQRADGLRTERELAGAVRG
eukprot:TRINITY_DN7620_c0_g1_i1.p1 TRINITY_DN7620_c0_g1~~TRINITY_DN7620_c0_g1_i1.p1  ORF type:complete len:450 (+),score=44.35 TRINITY_DN7620_c0_g1_i1:66-1352(+)